MRRCKKSGCQLPTAHSYGKPYCAEHLEEYKRRRAVTDAQPTCASCNNKARLNSAYCRACEQEQEDQRQMYEAQVTTLEALRDCTTLDELKDFIATEILPKLGD